MQPSSLASGRSPDRRRRKRGDGERDLLPPGREYERGHPGTAEHYHQQNGQGGHAAGGGRRLAQAAISPKVEAILDPSGRSDKFDLTGGHRATAARLLWMASQRIRAERTRHTRCLLMGQRPRFRPERVQRRRKR